jgi:CHAT domain-containing protein
VFGIGYGLAFAYVGRQALATQGDIELALTAAQCAATVFEVLESPWHQAQAHGDCAEALRLINAFESSLAEQEKAIQLMQDFLRDCSDPSRTDEIRATALQQVLALVQLACNVLDVGCLERAKGYAQEFSKGAAGFEQLMIGEIKQSIARMVDFYLPLIKGQIAIEAGQDEEAAQHFEDAIAHSIGHHDANFLKAMVYAAWRRYDESKAALRQYMAEAPQEIFPGLQMNSFVKMMQRVDPRKVELEQQQADLGKRNSLFTLYVTIRAWEEAQTQLKEIDRLTGASGTLDTVASRDDIQRHADRGLIAEGLGDLKVAQQYLTEAIAALENQRRRLHQDGYRRAFSGQRSVVGTYADLVRVLTDAGNWEGAFLEADKARAQVLAEALGGAKAALRQIKDTSQFRQYAEATAVVERLTTELALAQQLPDTQRLSDLKIKLQKATEIRNDKEQDLAEAEPDWRKLFAPQIEVISVADVAKVLPQNTLLLAYLFAGERLFAWAVSNQGLVGHHSLNQMNGKPFVARPFGNRVQVWVRNQGKADPEVGDELAISLIEPFGELITHASHLVIVPFAELNLVPFAALPWQGQPLGMQKSLSYLPSVSLLQHFRTPASDASGILVVGNPTDMAYEDLKSNEQVSLDPLPMARGGAELVAELYQVKPLIGSAATEEAVREAIKQHPRIIHLFTHGYLQEKVPLASGVALAKHEALTVDEFMGIDLRADVVILSACETGQGKLEGSELNGLARSILYAGARAVVVSLWKANDIANAILMYQLHRELRANKPLAWSLRDAQASLCKVTAQQALDFCRKAQAKIPITPDENLFDHALLTTYMGDILASANDYTHAVEAHRAAMNILSHLSQVNPVPSLLEKIQKDVEEWEFLAEEGYDNFNPDKLLYNSPQYWATFEIIGDWR